MSDPVSSQVENPYSYQRAFDAWSAVYDEQLNPLLALEQRYLLQMLPVVQGRDVVDIGCGTGRLLHVFAEKAPKTIIGIDPSPEMLRKAAAKFMPGIDLRLGSCTNLPLPDLSVDIVLASFVLSYVSDIRAFAQELNRIARPGAHIFVTDMHSKTAAGLHWKRSFRRGKQEIHLQTHEHPLQKIAEQLQSASFEIRAVLEPAFGPPEKPLFEESGKLAAYEAAAGLPAIYIAHLQKSTPRTLSSHAVNIEEKSQIWLRGAYCALGAEEYAPGTIMIESGNISSISSLKKSEEASRHINTIKLDGCMLLPGLINAHDHLEFGLFPKLGRGPYENALCWAQDIHRTYGPEIALYNRVPKEVRLWWGGIRNLLCGVTTVSHHNPLTPDLLSSHFPIRVLSDFGWAHSIYLDKQVKTKFLSTPDSYPFIIHMAEGIDQASANEIFQLEQMQALCDRTVLVHGLSLTREGIHLLNQRHASLIFCPSSNHFLFQRVPDISSFNSVANKALGSDSPLTAAGDLLDELKFARSEIGVDAKDLYEMVTIKPASILRLKNGEATLAAHSIADVIGVRHRGLSPAETLLNLTFDHIEIVLLAGQVQLASSRIYEQLPRQLQDGMQPCVIDNHIRWIRAPLGRLFTETKQVLGHGSIYLGGKEIKEYATTTVHC